METSDRDSTFGSAIPAWGWQGRCGYAEKRNEDDRFWSRSPRLEGDFPPHWKNVWVYDFETLRMMVRRPLGVYQHNWDAMQIQASRNVLAETSMDRWALSYRAGSTTWTRAPESPL
jgi:hypothetical protein